MSPGLGAHTSFLWFCVGFYLHSDFTPAFRLQAITFFLLEFLLLSETFKGLLLQRFNVGGYLSSFGATPFFDFFSMSRDFFDFIKLVLDLKLWVFYIGILKKIDSLSRRVAILRKFYSLKIRLGHSIFRWPWAFWIRRIRAWYPVGFRQHFVGAGGSESYRLGTKSLIKVDRRAFLLQRRLVWAKVFHFCDIWVKVPLFIVLNFLCQDSADSLRCLFLGFALQDLFLHFFGRT